MTINSAREAAKVKIGSKWSVLNEYHTSVTNEILKAGEVEVYKLRSDDFGVTVTVIYGEGETTEFDLYLFVRLFKHKPLEEDRLAKLNEYRANAHINWDLGTQADKSSLAMVCSTCFHHHLMSDAQRGTVIPNDNYECDHCFIVSSHKNKKTDFQPEQFLFDEVGLMEDLKKQPEGRLYSFLNKDPLSKRSFTWGFLSMALTSFLIPIFLNSLSVTSIVMQVAVWVLMILFVFVDAVRMKNKFNRQYKDF